MARRPTRWLAAAILVSGAVAAPRPAPAVCLGDCGPGGDANVDILDFLALLAQWGEVGTSCDGGGVGVTDFLWLLQLWGPCRTSFYLDLELDDVFRECERCIFFDQQYCTTTSVILTFTDHDGDPDTPVRYQGTITFEGLKCDIIAPICLKDEQHTLSHLWDPFIEPCAVLRPGDLDNDDDVDTVDMAVLVEQIGQAADPGGCPWDGTIGGDLNGDGFIDEADRALPETHLWQFGDCEEPSAGP